MNEPRQEGETVHLRLLEERAQVDRQRVVVGSVLLRREVETRRETVEVELQTETLVIRHQPAEGGASTGVSARVTIGDEHLAPGQEVRVVIYREEAQVHKRAVAVEEVEVSKVRVTETQTVPLELNREVLKVDTIGNVRLEGGNLQ